MGLPDGAEPNPKGQQKRAARRRRPSLTEGFLSLSPPWPFSVLGSFLSLRRSRSGRPPQSVPVGGSSEVGGSGYSTGGREDDRSITRSSRWLRGRGESHMCEEGKRSARLPTERSTEGKGAEREGSRADGRRRGVMGSAGGRYHGAVTRNPKRKALVLSLSSLHGPGLGRRRGGCQAGETGETGGRGRDERGYERERPGAQARYLFIQPKTVMKSDVLFISISL